MLLFQNVKKHAHYEKYKRNENKSSKTSKQKSNLMN